MLALNKVMLIGHVGHDPEVKYLPKGDPVASFSVATSERWTDKETSEKKEKTEWHRIVAWGKLATVAGDMVQKGTRVYVEGKLQTRKWEGKDGQQRQTTEINAFSLIVLDKGRVAISDAEIDREGGDPEGTSAESGDPDGPDGVPF